MAQINIDHLMSDLPNFYQQILQLQTDLGINLQRFEADHVALRVNDEKLAQQLHQDWSHLGLVISNNMINGRPIVVVKLNEALSFGDWQIDCVELPYPGEKKYNKEGWEHVEWVIPSQAQTVEAFLQDVFAQFPQLEQQWSDLSNQGIKVKMSSPAGAGERLANPTIAFQSKGICIKLHPASLAAVIESES